MATCDKCNKDTDKIFEHDGLWYCRECYPREVLKDAVGFDPDNSETLADLVYDDYWTVREPMRRMEDE